MHNSQCSDTPEATCPRPHGPAAPRSMRLFPLAVLGLFLFSFLLPTPATAACNRGAANCYNNTAGTMTTCTATLMCTQGVLSSALIQLTGMINVTQCNPALTNQTALMVTIPISAMALATAPPTRACSWNWATYSGNGNTSLKSSDGLPVELMDFSVEAEDEPPTDATDPHLKTSPEESR